MPTSFKNMQELAAYVTDLENRIIELEIGQRAKGNAPTLKEVMTHETKKTFARGTIQLIAFIVLICFLLIIFGVMFRGIK